MMAAQILGEELGWSTDRVFSEVRQSLELRWQEKLPVLEGTGLQQEELLAQTYFGVGGMDKV